MSTFIPLAPDLSQVIGQFRLDVVTMATDEIEIQRIIAGFPKEDFSWFDMYLRTKPF
jgi:hypothetical protein